MQNGKKYLLHFFGRLFDRVDLIKPVSDVGPFDSAQKVSSISMKFGM